MEKIENQRRTRGHFFLFFLPPPSFRSSRFSRIVRYRSVRQRRGRNNDDGTFFLYCRVLLFFPVLIPRRSTVSHGKERKSPWHEKRGKKKKKKDTPWRTAYTHRVMATSDRASGLRLPVRISMYLSMYHMSIYIYI